MKYAVPVPRPRGEFQITATPQQINIGSTGDNVHDMLLYAAICRLARGNETIEFDTKYNVATNTVELDIPTAVLDDLCQVNVGPNIARYFSWLTNASTNMRRDVYSFTIAENGGITTGTKGIGLQFASRCTIVRVDAFADVEGDIEIDLWRCSAENYPPAISDTIIGNSPVTIVSNVRSSDTTLAGWDTICNVGDVLYYTVDSASQIELVTIQLHVVLDNSFVS